MSNLTRYDCVTSGTYDCYGEMVKCDDGDYVKFDDIKEFLPTSVQQLKAEIAACVERHLVAINQPVCKVELSDFIKELRQLSAI
jgi:hypothetical protein